MAKVSGLLEIFAEIDLCTGSAEHDGWVLRCLASFGRKQAKRKRRKRLGMAGNKQSGWGKLGFWEIEY